MTKKKFTNRKVDKVPLKKSKSYMWRYIKGKTIDKAAGASDEAAGENVWDKLRSWLLMPAKLVSAGVVAVALVFLLVFTTNFNGWFDGEIGSPIGAPSIAHADFEMTAVDEGSDGVDHASSFVLASSEDFEVDDIAESLKVSPEVEIEVVKQEDGVFEITPVNDLSGNTIYKFSIETEEENFSWAYQVKDEFKVTGTLPGYQRTSVPIDSGIEIYFSHEDWDIKDAKKNFSISPNVSGSFEKHRNTLSFVPKGGLKEATLYTVTLKAGLELEDSDQSIDEDYSFQFETDDPDEVTVRDAIKFRHNEYELSTDVELGLRAYTYNFNDSGEESFEMKVYQYAGADDYIAALENVGEIPSWCYRTHRNFSHETDGLKLVGTFDAFTSSAGYQTYVYVPGLELDEGYYLVESQAGGNNQALIQVTDLSAYSTITETDTLIWVNDVENGEAVPGAKINAEGIDTIETDEDGIATFKTPEDWKHNDWTTSNYQYLSITDNGRTLITKLNPHGNENEGSKYWSHFETDRSVYQPDDTLQFWGYIEPRDNGEDRVEELEVKLEYGYRDYVDEMRVRVNPDGSFTGKMKLKTYESGYYSLSFFRDGNLVGTRSVRVESYIKPTYNLQLTTDKNAVFTGEEVEYEISTTFFDGTPASEVELKYYDNDAKDYVNLFTDESGLVSLDRVEESDQCYSDYYCGQFSYEYFTIRTADTDLADLYDESTVYVFKSEVGLETETEMNNGKATVKVHAFDVELSEINSEDWESSRPSIDDYRGESLANQKVTAYLTENRWEKIEDGEYYDFVSKTVKKNYRYEKISNQIDSFKISTDENGEGEYEFTPKEGYYYNVKFVTADSEGREIYTFAWVYGSAGRSENYDYYKIEIVNGESSEDDSPVWFSTPQTYFSMGDTVKTELYNNEAPINYEDGDRFLFTQLANGLKDYETTDEAKYDFEFTKDEVPNVNIAAVWFNGRYYEVFRAASAKLDASEKELEITVETDEAEYAPGAEVEMKLKVKDDGKAVSDAIVHVNLVDEAFYRMFRDSFIDPLDSLYSTLGEGVYSTQNTHDSLEVAEVDGGMGGCFTEDVEILMSDGSYKKINDVQVGDMILTKKYELSNDLIEARVVNLQEHYVQEYLVINGDLEVTGEHTMFVNANWDVAANVVPGDFFINKDGERVYVETVETVVEPVWVYNFEVEGAHTYFANDIYVHNDKGGGSEVRMEFKDTALFVLAHTDSQGEAVINFTLPDNITSWRSAVSVIDPEEKTAGYDISNVIVTKPFFTEVVVNPEYSVKDSPEIKLQSYGDEVESGDNVSYQVESESLGMERSESFDGDVYRSSYFPLSELSVGDHDVTVYSQSGEYEDNVRKEFEVVGSRLSEYHVEHVYDIEGDEDRTEDSRSESYEFDLKGDGMHRITLLDGGIAKYYGDLLRLSYVDGDRLDQRLARVISAEMLNEFFGENNYVDDEDIAVNYQDSGLMLLPYGESDLRLTANVLLMDNNVDRYNTRALAEYLYEVYVSDDSNLEEVVYAVSGLAALGEPVLLSLRSLAAGGDLDLQEMMYIALAFESLGSRGDAWQILDEAWDDLVDTAEEDESVMTTALGSILAGSLGEMEKSDLLWEFVELIGTDDDSYAQNEDILDIYKLGLLTRTLPNLRPETARFVVEKNGDIEDVQLERWERFSVWASPDDELSVEVLNGTLDATVAYEEMVSVSEFKVDDSVSVNRTYYVDGKETTKFAVGDVVEVVIDVNYVGNAESRSFRVTDVLPSGLKPLTGWREIREQSGNYRYPYHVDGQEVSFYWNEKGYNGSVKYLARVAAVGEYYADPAKAQHYTDESIVGISESAMVKIEK